MGNPFFKPLLKGLKVKVDPTDILNKKFDKLVKQDELPLKVPVTKKEANIPVFPKPERMFPEDARPKGGDYLNPITKESLTGRNVSSANIKVTSEGKPSFKISDDNVDNVGSTDKGSSKIRVNLFKKKAGWKWQDAPEGYEDVPTLVSVEHKGKHFYTLETDFDKGVNLSRYPDKKSEPRLRPTVTGKIELGSQVGTISVRGKEHPVYGKIKTYDTGGLAVSDLEEFASKLIGRQGEPLILDENVGEDTGEVTKVGRPKKRTSEGETVSEKSTTIEIDGKHYNLPSIYGNKKYSDFVLKRALIEGVIKETSVHYSREEAEEAAERRSKGLNQGGTMLGQQTEMAFMNEGGMKDDGGKTEPTSGNKVPSGSLEEEVADDIPAMLSEGEFVFPADVVRFIGLSNLMKMRQDAKQGLKMMEKMGQLGNPEEAEIPDDVPFGMADLVVVSGKMDEKEEKAEGGVVGLANGGGLFDDPRFQTASTGQPDPTVYTPEEEQEVKGALDEPMQPSDIQIKKVVNPDDPNDFMMWSFDKEGNPLYPIPDGYIVDDTPVEDAYSNVISRKDDPRDTTSSDDSSPAPDGMGSGMTLPKESDFVDSDQYKKGQYALFSRGKPIRLQETTLDNLSMEYDKLKKLDGMEKLTFQDYYNLPSYDKARFSLGMTLGREPTATEINAAIQQAKKSPTGLLSFLNPVVGAIKSFLSPDASGGFTDDTYRKERQLRQIATTNLDNLMKDPRASTYGKGDITADQYDKYKSDTSLQSQALFPSTGKVGKIDDFLSGVRRDPKTGNPMIWSGERNPDGSPIVTPLTADVLARLEKNRRAATDPQKALDRMREQTEQFTSEGIQRAEERAGSGQTGDLDTVAQNVAHEQRMREAEAIARGTPRSSSGGGRSKPVMGSGDFGASEYANEFSGIGGWTPGANKGGLAKPKAKPKRMKKGGLASSKKKK